MLIRTVTKNIENQFFKGKAILLFGARQTGKTTLIKELLEKQNQQYLELNGDEPDVRLLLENAGSARLKAIVGKSKIVFIDEAQRIKDIGLVLKLFTDQLKDVQVIASGSSAFELANKTNEPLTGRKYEHKLFPFSFDELSSHSNLLEERRAIEQRLVFGSYPEIVKNPADAKERLKLLAGSYLYKDILSLGIINKPAVLENILKALALQIGSEVSYLEIAQLIGVDKSTVEKYIDLLEKTFVIFKLPAYSKNVRNELKKSKKIYFYDVGIRNAVINNFNLLPLRTDIGALWENYLISERYKFLSNSGYDPAFYFWRTTQQQEIDYLEESADGLQAFEFKWNPKQKYRFTKVFTGAYPDCKTTLVNQENYDRFLLEY